MKHAPLYRNHGSTANACTILVGRRQRHLVTSAASMSAARAERATSAHKMGRAPKRRARTAQPTLDTAPCNDDVSTRHIAVQHRSACTRAVGHRLRCSGECTHHTTDKPSLRIASPGPPLLSSPNMMRECTSPPSRRRIHPACR